MKLYDAYKNNAKGNKFEKVYLNEKYEDAFFELNNQPERSKREDLVNTLIDSQEKIWGKVEIDQVFNEDDFKKSRMRCSELYGNIERDK